jgi:sulfur-carrier protein
MAKIRIPSQLRNEVNNQAEVEISGNNVGEALNALSEQFPALKPRLFDENGKLRRYVNIYLDDEDIRFLDDLDTSLEDGSELALVPAIAGGI